MTGSIYVENIGKLFRNVDQNRSSTLKGSLLTRRKRVVLKRLWGLRHISFGVATGRAVGVVGRNGAGKSTLLRIIGGVTRPNEGHVRIDGRIGALLEITAGLTDDLTGRENIHVMGVIAGMLRREVDVRMDEIIAFAELADSIDRPVRTYSTGMKMRLSFSVAVHGQPDVLLVDEVLAVGDAAFQAKCFDRIRAIKASGCTIFLVSHDIEQIRALCDEVLFLRDGRVVAYGPAEETLALFTTTIEQAVAAQPAEVVPLRAAVLEPDVNRFGSQTATIGSVELLSRSGNPVSTIVVGAALRVRFAMMASRPLKDVIAVVGIYADDLTPCLEVSSAEVGLTLDLDANETVMVLDFERLDLAAGQYLVTIGIFSADWREVFDYHAESYAFQVVGPTMGKGHLRPRLNWVGGLAGSHVEF